LTVESRIKAHHRFKQIMVDFNIWVQLFRGSSLNLTQETRQLHFDSTRQNASKVQTFENCGRMTSSRTNCQLGRVSLDVIGSTDQNKLIWPKLISGSLIKYRDIVPCQKPEKWNYPEIYRIISKQLQRSRFLITDWAEFLFYRFPINVPVLSSWRIFSHARFFSIVLESRRWTLTKSACRKLGEGWVVRGRMAFEWPEKRWIRVILARCHRRWISVLMPLWIHSGSQEISCGRAATNENKTYSKEDSSDHLFTGTKRLILHIVFRGKKYNQYHFLAIIARKLSRKGANAKGRAGNDPLHGHPDNLVCQNGCKVRSIWSESQWRKLPIRISNRLISDFSERHKRKWKIESQQTKTTWKTGWQTSGKTSFQKPFEQWSTCEWQDWNMS
jgi:hypothetical protein